PHREARVVAGKLLARLRTERGSQSLLGGAEVFDQDDDPGADLLTPSARGCEGGSGSRTARGNASGHRRASGRPDGYSQARGTAAAARRASPGRAERATA